LPDPKGDANANRTWHQIGVSAFDCLCGRGIWRLLDAYRRSRLEPEDGSLYSDARGSRRARRNRPRTRPPNVVIGPSLSASATGVPTFMAIAGALTPLPARSA